MSPPSHLPFSASPPRNFNLNFFPPPTTATENIKTLVPPSILTPQVSSNKVPNPSYVPPKVEGGFKHVNSEVEGSRVNASVTVSFIGHVDHGKSTLTTTLNRMLKEVSTSTTTSTPSKKPKKEEPNTCDTLSCELERGVTYSPSLTTFKYSSTIYNILDNPGHNLFSETLIPSHFETDVSCIIVSCRPGEVNDFEGSPVKKEIKLLKLLGINKFIIVVNKIELKVGKSDLQARVLVEQYLTSLNITQYQTCYVSGSTGAGILSGVEGNPSLIDCVKKYVMRPKGEKSLRAYVTAVNEGSKKGNEVQVMGKVIRGKIMDGDTILLPELGKYGRLIVGRDLWPGDSFTGIIKGCKILKEGDGIVRSNDKSYEVRRRFMCMLRGVESIVPGVVRSFYMNGLKCQCVVVSVVKDGVKKKILKKGEEAECLCVLSRGVMMEKFEECKKLGRFVVGRREVEGVGRIEELL